MFPKEPERRQIWLKFVDKIDWTPSKYSVLSSKHFLEKFVDRTSLSYVRLRSDAAPMLKEVNIQGLFEISGNNI